MKRVLRKGVDIVKKDARMIISLLFALCLLVGMTAALAEDGDVQSAPVELAVGEQDAELAAPAEATPIAGGQAVSPAEDDIPIDEAHFPDAGFRGIIATQHGPYDKNGDGVLSWDERSGVERLYLVKSYSSFGMRSNDYHFDNLKGLEYFPNLKELECWDAGLTKLDVSGNPLLTTLDCSMNDLTKLDLSGNPALTTLNCSANRLTTLKLSGAAALTSLSCSDNMLAKLNLSGNPALASLSCGNNPLTKLDLRANPALTVLDCSGLPATSLSLAGNQSLKTFNYRSDVLTSLNMSGCAALENLDVSGCESLTKLKLDGCTALTNLTCGYTALTKLDLSGNQSLVNLDCEGGGIEKLILSNCPKLNYLVCRNGTLTSLDVSGCPALEYVYAQNNAMTTLNVGNCARLKNLYCFNNRLTSLNVLGCVNLEQLHCYGNALETLDLSSAGYVRLGAKTTPTTQTTDGVKIDTYMYFFNNWDNHVLIVNASVQLITDKPEPVSIGKAVVTVKAQVYTGEKLTPKVTVTLDGVKLAKGTDYTVSYKNNKAVGTATVTVKGIGGYTGTAKQTFKINPKKVIGLKLTAGAKQLTVAWKKVSGATGYQVQYGLKKSFSGAKKLTLKKAATVMTVLKKLKANKTYYVRIRAYKTVDGKNYYSGWVGKSLKTK